MSHPKPKVGWKSCHKWLGAGIAAGQVGLGHIPPTGREVNQADRPLLCHTALTTMWVSMYIYFCRGTGSCWAP